MRLSTDTELFKSRDTACKEAADEAKKLWVKYYYISYPVMNYGQKKKNTGFTIYSCSEF